MDDKDFQHIFKNKKALLMAVAIRHLDNQSWLEDALQETLLRAWLFRDNFREESLVTSWVLRILINTCKNFNKHERTIASSVTQSFSEIEETYEGEGNNAFVSPEEIYSIKEQTDWLIGAFKNLPPSMLTTGILRFVYEWPYAAIAESQNIPIGTVRSRIKRIKEYMRKFRSVGM